MTYSKNHQKSILSLLTKDQKNICLYKKGYKDFEKMKKESDNISNEFMAIVDDVGFPFLNIVPNDVYKSAIVLSLHLPASNLEYMFNKMKNISSDMFDSVHMAYFIDKILIHSGKKQKYGTQYKINKDGVIVILPIEDYKKVEIRRAVLGLETLEEYKNKIILI